MTREEQIDWLCRLRADLNNGVIFTPWNKEFTEALNDVLEQEPCDDAISRQEVLYLIADYDLSMGQVVRGIHALPSVTSQEPKTGHWIGIDEEPHEDYECDKCGYTISTYTANIEPHTEYKYCPNCGAKMVEPQESEKTEVWNGIHAQITAPKGTFERIFNDADDEDDI